MNQEEKIGDEITETSVEIPMTIESVINRNVDFMKNWSDSDISRLFCRDGKLRSFRKKFSENRTFSENLSAYRVDLVQRTRKLTVAALRLVFEEEKMFNPYFKIPTKVECTRIANDLISEENIRSKFDLNVIVYA